MAKFECEANVGVMEVAYTDTDEILGVQVTVLILKENLGSLSEPFQHASKELLRIQAEKDKEVEDKKNPMATKMN